MKKKRFKDDPFAGRESENYERPIPSREFIAEKLSQTGRLFTFKKLAVELKLSEEVDLDALKRRLRAMERDGQLIRNRRGEFGLVKKMDLIKGRVIGHADGFGFLVPDDGGNDLFISGQRMRGLLHGDRIVARVAGIDRRGRREGAPVEVLERANSHIVGRFRAEHGIGFVAASNKKITQDVLIPAEHRGDAKDGQIVVAEILEQPTWRAQPIGRIHEVLGDHLAPGMEIDVAIRSYEIPSEWPEAVQAQIKNFTASVSEQEMAEREDLRHLPLVTIDGEDARDFDDAVYAERKGKGWRLLVAIADVSHYVKPASALDEEALTRGNSVYFPERVVPMLPEILSNELCSLKPHVDRLCLVCEMMISHVGTVRQYRFFDGVMRSAQRFTYNQVAAILQENDKPLRKQYTALVPHLEVLYDLYQVLLTRRERRGTIEFETTETQIVFGENKKIDRIVPVVRNDAHRLIEECMIAANVAAADYLAVNEVPALYRIHNPPTEEKLTDVRAFLKEFGLRFGGRKSTEPKHYRKLLESIQERPDARMIELVLLRSLSQAVYCSNNSGHFGLAFDAYTHFTSPIRRYPDLLVHRAIRSLISHKKKYHYSTEDIDKVGEHCSMTERRADDATRDVLDWLKCEYMQAKVGENFAGRISAVTSFGIFVELNDIYVEGLVHVTALGNDYFHFDSAKHRLSGERTGQMFQLSDPVQIKVVRVNLEDKKIDFELVTSSRKKAKTKAKRK